MMTFDEPKNKQCDRYCRIHPMERCGGSLGHRSKHQCPECQTPSNPRGEYV